MIDQFNDTNKIKIALLIDGDNAQPTLIEKILAETGKHGPITIRRIYGDWTTPNMNGWKETLNNLAIQPIQQFCYTVGKNSTDSAMIIDAMDILHNGSVEGFCIVSSDSDYTRLATRIRESGIFVMGIGEHKTPKPFVNACNIFVYTENLIPEDSTLNRKNESNFSSKIDENDDISNPVPLLKESYEMALREDGWAHLGTMGDYLRQLDPSFDPRSYGYKQLSQLVKAYPKLFELKYQDENGSVYVRIKG
ncbi:MAG: NYN domain-containing protein [Methanosarcinales archaeon]|nr:NYN domain-containing protein [Methanosarcinales archaeon]